MPEILHQLIIDVPPPAVFDDSRLEGRGHIRGHE